MVERDRERIIEIIGVSNLPAFRAGRGVGCPRPGHRRLPDCRLPGCSAKDPPAANRHRAEPA